MSERVHRKKDQCGLGIYSEDFLVEVRVNLALEQSVIWRDRGEGFLVGTPGQKQPRGRVKE